MKKEISLVPIKNGTVVDHILGGQALNVLKILKISTQTSVIVSLVMNVRSKKKGRKDVVMIEDRVLLPKELNKIALISPNATINIIKDSVVVKKYNVELPESIKGLIRCSNLNCITNAEREPVESEFIMVKEGSVRFQCQFCDKIICEKDIANAIFELE